MTALEVLQNVLSLMDKAPTITCQHALVALVPAQAKGATLQPFDKAVELLMAYADPFDDDTPTHRLYGRLYRWCRSVSLETQRDAVVWAIGVLEGCQARAAIRTADGREADTEDVQQWFSRT